jgi:hypothetical protein
MNREIGALRFRALVLTVIVLLGASFCGGVSVSDRGSYRTNTGERAPAEIIENVRIIPPPTGGDLQVRVRPDRAKYHVGDPIRIEFGVNRDSYVYIFDTDASGITRQIFPNYYDRQNFIRAGRTYRIPDRSYDLEVTLPTGRETLAIVAVAQDFRFLSDYNRFSRKDPYPASHEGAAGLVRRIESFRHEPPSTEMRAVRPVPRRDLWAEDTATFYVMGRRMMPPYDYRVARYGSLDVDTYPNNARIYIDHEYYGRSPQVIDRLEIGYHRVHIEKEGYQPYTCNVYIKGNKTKSLDIFLKETPVYPSRKTREKSGGGIGFFYR